MKRKEILEALWDNDLRIDKIIWLGANSAHFNDDLREFLDDDDGDCLRLLGHKPPKYRASADQVIEFLAFLSRKGKNGYLVQASNPVYECLGGTTISFSWGYYNTQWFYFEEWDETAVAEALLAWQKARYKAAIAKRAAKDAAKQ